MAKINPCFKKTFVFFNVLFAVFGFILLVLGVLIHVFLEEVENKLTAVIVLYVAGAATFIISVVGAYGAQKENKYALIAFFTCMCSGAVILFRLAVPVAISHKEVFSTIKGGLHQLVPLDNALQEAQHAFIVFQKEFKCCGIFTGYQDWGQDIPDSCDCVSDKESDQCQMTSVSNYRTIFEPKSKSKMVYKQPCGPLMMQYLEKVLSVTLGVMFGLAALALLGSVMSLAMIIRISALAQSPVPSFSLSYQPPKYSELEEDTSKLNKYTLLSA